MSLADIKIAVLNRFLDDYLEQRQKTWHSIPGVIKKSGEQFVAYLMSAISTSQKDEASSVQEEKLEPQDDETINTNICSSFKDLFLKAKSVNHWVTIIFDLGVQARQAQLRSKSSLLSQTLHAIRTYIIQHLQNEEQFIAHISRLTQEKHNLDQTIFERQVLSLDIDELESKRNALLYNLADLGDNSAIFECRRVGLFKTLTFPAQQLCHKLAHTSELASNPELNIYKPWYYQCNYFLRHHDKCIKPIKNESFIEFEQRAERNGNLIVKARDASDSRTEYSEPKISPSLVSMNTAQINHSVLNEAKTNTFTLDSTVSEISDNPLVDDSKAEPDQDTRLSTPAGYLSEASRAFLDSNHSASEASETQPSSEFLQVTSDSNDQATNNEASDLQELSNTQPQNTEESAANSEQKTTNSGKLSLFSSNNPGKKQTFKKEAGKKNTSGKARSKY